MRRWVVRGLGVLSALVVLLAGCAVIDGWQAFGHRASGARRAQMAASPQWGGSGFVNPQPLINDHWGSARDALRPSPYASPAQAFAVADDTRGTLARPPASGLRVTWLGHSTTLVEIDGARVLTDPIFSERASPLRKIGPRRWHAPPVALAELPPIDVVVISHDHYDHLDRASIVAMKDWRNQFVVPLGLGAHLAYWGIPEARITELDWWGRTEVAGLGIVATPARHASGRMLIDDDAKLWAGYALIGTRHRVYFSGDTGLFPAMRDIGARLGPFDLTMIEVGQYGRSWPDWHLGPEQAVRAHRMVRGQVMLPVHWATFTLAFHGWTEPIERALVAAEAAGVALVVPRPGEGVEPAALASPPLLSRWWPAVPWQRAEANPIVSSQME